MMEQLFIEFIKHNDKYNHFEFKDGYSYEIHTINKDDLLEFANEVEFQLKTSLYDVNYLVVRVQESKLGDRMKVLGLFDTIHKAQERMKANKRDLLSVIG